MFLLFLSKLEISRMPLVLVPNMASCWPSFLVQWPYNIISAARYSVVKPILARLRPNDRNDELPSSEHPGGHERGDEDVLGKPGGQGDHPLLC